MSELLTSFRHELHAHPELAHAEHATADRVVAFMQQFNPTEIVTGIAGTGVVVTFDSGVEGPRMLFRCELDALPIVETGVDGYASVDAGVSHKCGHDGHMTMIAGLGEALAARPLKRGVVHLLFQPAEETGTGAAAVAAAGSRTKPGRERLRAHGGQPPEERWLHAGPRRWARRI